MTSILLSCLFLSFILFMCLSWRYLFILILLLDLLGLFIILSASFSSSSLFIIILVILVYSNVLGITLLIINVRNTGSDSVSLFL